MDFYKRFSLYFLILAVSFVSTGCSKETHKAFFKRDSAYDSVMANGSESSKPRRVGNVIYLGSESTAGTTSQNSGGPSFEFENLRR